MHAAAADPLSVALRQGDQQALGDAYERHAAMVRRYLAHFVGWSEADDLLQVVFLEAWRSRGRLDPDRSLEAWLLGIARKRAIDHLRRRRHDVVDVDSLRQLVSEDGREYAERVVWAAEVDRALGRLPAPQRETVRMVYFDQMTLAEAAATLGVPVGTVKARISRAVQRLGTMLEGGRE